MDSRASGRLALTIAAGFLAAALVSSLAKACENCAPADARYSGKAVNELPLYKEDADEPAAPVAVKPLQRTQVRTARRAAPRKASLAQRAAAGRKASRVTSAARAQTDSPARTLAARAPAARLVDANAELVEPDVARPVSAPAVAEAQSTPAPVVELVSAEDFNDLDRMAWEANQMPKLMKLTASDARAELSEDDSRWAQTSTIGKLFVAFGALLTIGSAIRMFMA